MGRIVFCDFVADHQFEAVWRHNMGVWRSAEGGSLAFGQLELQNIRFNLFWMLMVYRLEHLEKTPCQIRPDEYSLGGRVDRRPRR